eukprot:365865-Chlamydomonas_euryale.AAC.18
MSVVHGVNVASVCLPCRRVWPLRHVRTVCCQPARARTTLTPMPMRLTRACAAHRRGPAGRERQGDAPVPRGRRPADRRRASSVRLRKRTRVLCAGVDRACMRPNSA